MRLALSKDIREIDNYLVGELGLSPISLMRKSGDAVARVIRDRAPMGSTLAFLAGKGNNGGDAYAAAVSLASDYDVTVYDIFSAGQRTDEGKHFLAEFLDMGGKIINYDFSHDMIERIKSSDVIVDAVFGTGVVGELPEELRTLSVGIREAVGCLKISIDVPLGINADDGSLSDFAVSVDITVELSFIKPGIISYPARAYVGEIVYDSLDLPIDELTPLLSAHYYMMRDEAVFETLPKREANSNKSTFGKLLMIIGSEKYRGAAHLATEAALRSGVGYVNYLGSPDLVAELRMKYPEVIYHTSPEVESYGEEEISAAIKLAGASSALLVGSGSDNTDGLAKLVVALLESDGCPLVLDADAINALAFLGEKGRAVLKNTSRRVILTPHPLEFARLAGMDVATVQLSRLEIAKRFAAEYGVVLILKGAGTIITDGENVVINTLGSSALAKAGSGDVLAGLLASILAQGRLVPMNAAALAVALHSSAAVNLSHEFSSYGVTPSDLPKEIARILAKFD